MSFVKTASILIKNISLKYFNATLISMVLSLKNKFFHTGKGNADLYENCMDRYIYFYVEVINIVPSKLMTLTHTLINRFERSLIASLREYYFTEHIQ